MREPFVFVLAFVGTATVAGCRASSPESSRGDIASNRDDAPVMDCPGDNAGIILPTGFCARIYADSLGAVRHLTVAANGDVFANVRTRGRTPGALLALRDTNGDGRADSIARIPGARGGTGVAHGGGFLYADQGRSVVRYRLAAGSMLPASGPDTVVYELPDSGHSAHGLVLAPGARLLMNVGSRTNACQLQDRTAASPGGDPCAELATRAGIWSYDANGTAQRHGPSNRVATGIRNAIALARNPADGRLYAAVHGRDQLAQHWPALFSEQQSAENPAEELVAVDANDDFGWPYCFYSGERKQRVLAPEYGGDGTRTERCTNRQQPAVTFPAHWAPNALAFYDARHFPARYRGGAFIAFHGSWNRAPLPQGGYVVAFVPFTDGRPNGTWETFADGFAGVPLPIARPQDARHRATGVAVGPDGALYVSDDAGGRIYRITWGR